MTSWITTFFTPPQVSHLITTNGQSSTSRPQFQEHGVEKELARRPRQEEKKRVPLAEEDKEAARPPYIYSMFAGGVGGTTGDLLMHSIDTVKTRQQGDPNFPPKYTSLPSSYAKIFRQEGLRRGLYSGVTPAFLGSFPGTIIFFGTYEYSKRNLIDAGMNPSLAYLASGFIADLAASFVYVPSEVLKTRLQLQGRYNNPFFNSGYNYRSTAHAAQTIIRFEGVSALFYGYKATIFRDLPFSAFQFAFYEQEQKWAKQWVGGSEIGLGLEILTAATAGGMAGVLTCPLDVVKTRIQTQLNPQGHVPSQPRAVGPKKEQTQLKPQGHVPNKPRVIRPQTEHNVIVSCNRTTTASSAQVTHSNRCISTSSPNTTVPKAGSVTLHTSSILTGLRVIYKTEGVMGLFRGVGPRILWTSVQSGTMLVLYQEILRKMQTHIGWEDTGMRVA